MSEIGRRQNAASSGCSWDNPTKDSNSSRNQFFKDIPPADQCNHKPRAESLQPGLLCLETAQLPATHQAASWHVSWQLDQIQVGSRKIVSWKS